ncbi:flagellar filament capping protein FliD [Desulfovibrio sp. OttesenSCG-928-O18]|nr:flagellar filament capping protein FliD [Desulfovibrio sp. OttesenSCG-928-O18]
MSGTIYTSSNYMPGSSISGGLSISGLGNGTDFSSMISQLKQIEMIPTQRLLRWKADWRDRQDAFRTVRESLVALRDVCNKMNTMDKFLVKNATSSHSTVATATASSSAIENSYRLDVNQVATTSIWSLNNSFYDNKSIVNNSGTNQKFSYEYAGTVRNLTIPPNTTLEQLKNIINNDAGNPGVRVSLISGADGVTFQMKGLDQGAKNDLSILGASGLTGFPPATDYNAHTALYKTDFNALTDVVNSSGSDKVFTYSYNGTTKSVTIPTGTTVEGFIKLVNGTDDGTASGTVDGSNMIAGMGSVSAAINPSSGKVEISFAGGVQGVPVEVPKGKPDLFEKFGIPTTYQPHTSTYKSNYTALTDVVNNTGSDQVFSYSYNGETKNITVPTGTTVQGLVGLINADLPTGMKPVTAAVNGGKVEVNFSGELDGVPVQLPSNFGEFGAAVSSQGDPANWHIQHSQNALIKVDGWPSGEGNWLEVSSNKVTDVVEGVTFTLVGEGSSIVSVNVDAEAVQENVVQFIEAVNSFRKTVLDLTKYDENKETLDVAYAESLYEMQKGSILTGNYGIQLLSSKIKQATAGSPKGFLPRTFVDDVAFGDLYTSLSQIGIKTNASGEGGDMFGLLELNTDPKFPMLDDVLKKNPEAVAEFFSAVNKGVSDSSHFSYSSSLQSLTRPGAYEVNYTIDAGGNVTGTINGKEAKWDPETNELGLARKDPETSNTDILTAKTSGASDWEANVEVMNLAHNSYVTMTTDMTSGTDPYVTTAGKFYYTVGGQTHSINVAAGDSVGEICGKINYSVGNPGVTATWKEVGGKIELTLTSKQAGGDGPALSIPSAGDNIWGTTNGSSITAGDTGADAVIKVNGTEERHKTNSVESKTVPGASFNLKKAEPGTIVNVKAKAHNDADGLYIKIDNLTRNETYTGQVRIKQGKIPELIELLSGTPSKPEEGILGSKGTIQVLLDNYDKIVEGIDTKISKETTRLTKWERTQKLRFARLEATLKQYDSLQKSIESQVKQLSSSSS